MLKSISPQVWIYILIALAFGAFFVVILLNTNSRYNMRLRQSQNRIDSRMQMMRNNYVTADSLFRLRQDSIRRADSLRGGRQ